MRFPIELLVLACLIVGIIPGLTIGGFLDTAVRSVLGMATPDYSLAVWHGFTLPLLMSTIALIGGIGLYFALQGYLKKGIEGPPFYQLIRDRRIFERVLVVLSWRFARTLEGFLGTRRLQPQLRLLAGAALLAGAIPLLQQGIGPWRPPRSAIDPVLAVVWFVGIICALAAAYQAKYHRLAALILMGGAGLVTCVTFIWLSAPDLALTQLLVVIVATVLLLLGLRWLPKRVLGADADARDTGLAPARRLRDFIIAITAGCGVALLAYATMTRPTVDSIAQYFIDNAYTKAGGTNIVNVILVDFRGFDTLGEITVLGVVALTVYALLRRFRPATESIDVPEQQRTQNYYDEVQPDRQRGTTLAESITVPAVIMRLMFPVIIVVALFLLLRGHDQPGGGFVAGLTLAVAFILQYMAFGTRWVEDRLRILPVRWIGTGLLLAALTGAAAWLFGRPFLTSYFGYAELPFIGKIPTASALAFDLGVFALVVGATVLVLIALAHQSVRTHRAPRTPSASVEGR
jgi:multicomponent K+:H+ antiporter subunit A